MPIYMKFDGIDGAVTAEGHEKWIELQSCQMGVNRHITSAQGRGTNREAAVPALSEIVVTKYQDDATIKLWQASLHGEGKKVNIDFCKTDKDKFEPYLQIELENTLISSYSVSGSGGDSNSRPMESLALNFTKITYGTTAMAAENATASPEKAGWDLALGKGV